MRVAINQCLESSISYYSTNKMSCVNRRLDAFQPLFSEAVIKASRLAALRVIVIVYFFFIEWFQRMFLNSYVTHYNNRYELEAVCWDLVEWSSRRTSPCSTFSGLDSDLSGEAVLQGWAQLLLKASVLQPYAKSPTCVFPRKSSLPVLKALPFVHVDSVFIHFKIGNGNIVVSLIQKNNKVIF